MFKQFEDFLFAGKKFSDLSCEYIPANLNTDFEISLALERDMESGTKNNYRPEANYFGDSWSDTLTLELHIIKSPTKYPDQESQFLSKKDLREITRWLTSPHYPQWIVFDLPSDADDDVVRYRGWFSNIEPLPLDDKIYGLKLFFTCTTPFGYTTTITQKKQVITYAEQTVVNNSDESLTYCYPVITILPHDNGEIFLCNLSDCNLLDSGKFSDQASFSSLINVIEDYSAQKGYIVTYTGTGSKNIIPLCQNTAVQFYLRDVYNGTVKKCTAFYRMDTKEYRIVDGGFVYMKVYQNLDISMDCQFLTINDSIGRMVTYDKLGITDVDHVYWPRLLHGENHLLLYGNADFIVQHQESRKAGEY
jgi:hypothetical protein